MRAQDRQGILEAPSNGILPLVLPRPSRLMPAWYVRLYWPWLPLVFTTIALVWSGLWLGSNGMAPTVAVVLEQVVPEVLYWNLWAAITPVVWVGVQREGVAFRTPSRRWAVHLLMAIAASGGVYLVSLALFSGVYAMGQGLGVPQRTPLASLLDIHLATLVSFRMPFGCIVYAAIAGFALAADYVRRLHRAEERSARLRAQLAEAELSALKMQLQPHFLFNALNTVSAALHDDPEAADDMLARLGGFLRLTLDHADRDVVPLWEEVEFCQRYLAIEQDRFEERLDVSLDVAPDAREACVPHLLLQPLVENAMRHGVAKHVGPGRIAVSCERAQSDVIVRVTNTAAPGVAVSTTGRTGGGGLGVGIANTRARLSQAFEGASLTYGVAGHEVQATLRFPYVPFVPESCPAESSLVDVAA